ncbi:hypothetical protein ACQ4N7_26220 [Nodosilinea sp. AN01ver1]|uniref:hypothetical protein n=1 Tax=Nodosilinea sp. AN01ver1 TaxID=3423362 RepID=UPI003D31CC06
MTEEKPSQSLNISGGQFSGGIQVGQAGRDLSQTQRIVGGNPEKQLTVTEVVELISQIENLFETSDLPSDQQEKAIKHLETAKEEVQAKDPDKDFAMKSLQRATKVLKEANEAVGAGEGLWKKLEPIVTQLAPWLGVAAKALLLI